MKKHQTRWFLWQALFGLLIFDVLRCGVHFSRLHGLVKHWKTSTHSAPPDALELICSAVNYACVWYPKRVRCLQRAAVTTCLLRSIGVSAEMVMGNQKMPFKAHAWTEVNGRAINERRDVQAIYAVWERC